MMRSSIVLLAILLGLFASCLGTDQSGDDSDGDVDVDADSDSDTGCTAPEIDCDGTCVDAQTDLQNCGSCGVACEGDFVCLESACQCDERLTDCGEAGCLDVLSEQDHCGSCDLACGASMTCEEGACDCGLGTVFPARVTIDPDNPVHSEAGWTEEEVRQAFADARKADNMAYRGYRAANTYPDLLLCAFCECGCEAVRMGGHLSGVDCFKSMHGFN